VSRFIAVIVLGLAVSLVLASGCSRPQGTTSPPRVPPVGKAAAPAVPQTESPAPAPSAESATKSASAPAPELSAYAWTETPLLSQIPAGPVKGALHGKLFEPKSVVMDVKLGKLRMIEFSDKAMESDSDTLSSDTQVVVTTTEDLAPGYKIETAMGLPHKEGTIFYSYMDGTTPASMNSPWACALTIESGEKKPYSASGPTVQVAGTYKGKIHLCFNDDFKSYIAGEFEAKIRYFGAP